MADSKFQLSDEARVAAGAAWFDYLQLLDPFRPDLFRYCRSLTGDVWDAEDLVQDTLEQGFAKLASVHHSISKPRAYLLRIASNLWIDRMRRRGREKSVLDTHQHDNELNSKHEGSAEQTVAVRDAGATLMHRLSPQERAAIVLKDVFELSLEETASVLTTSVGAIKAALHRGRRRLRDPTAEASERPHPSKEVMDRFVDRYNARDLPGLLKLLLDDASIEMVGHVLELGRDGFERDNGWMHHNFYNPIDGTPSTATWEITEFRSEPIVLVWGDHAGARVLSSVMRCESDGECVTRIHVYALCPDVIHEVATELELPVSAGLMYRFPFPMSAS
jgi:RNA polymerase sigma-70 factor (ECF subfamily)